MCLHTTNMTMSDLIFGVDRHRECLNGRKISLFSCSTCLSASSTRPIAALNVKYNTNSNGMMAPT
jgi:hypothetical protein